MFSMAFFDCRIIFRLTNLHQFGAFNNTNGYSYYTNYLWPFAILMICGCWYADENGVVGCCRQQQMVAQPHAWGFWPLVELQRVVCCDYYLGSTILSVVDFRTVGQFVTRIRTTQYREQQNKESPSSIVLYQLFWSSCCSCWNNMIIIVLLPPSEDSLIWWCVILILPLLLSLLLLQQQCYYYQLVASSGSCSCVDEGTNCSPFALT